MLPSLPDPGRNRAKEKQNRKYSSTSLIYVRTETPSNRLSDIHKTENNTIIINYLLTRTISAVLVTLYV